MKRLVAMLVAVLVLVPALAIAQEKTIADLPWQQGPTKAALGDTATVDVPKGYAFLGPDGAREFNRLTENPDPGVDEYVLAKDDFSWVAFFSFDPVGFVKDDEKLDAEALLESVREGTEASNEERRRNGWAPLHVTGWEFKPQYDTQIRSLEWAFRLRGEGASEDTINYNTRILGRKGVMQVLVLTSPAEIRAAVADFKNVLPNYRFNAGEGYAEFREGDRIAEYGLAALVTGGAAAVASKKGFFAAIALFFAKAWKLVLVGVLAVGAWLRSRLSKKGGTRES